MNRASPEAVLMRLLLFFFFCGPVGSRVGHEWAMRCHDHPHPWSWALGLHACGWAAVGLLGIFFNCSREGAAHSVCEIGEVYQIVQVFL